MYTSVCVRVCACVFVWGWVWVCGCLRVCVFVCACVCARACMCACLRMCVRAPPARAVGPAPGPDSGRTTLPPGGAGQPHADGRRAWPDPRSPPAPRASARSDPGAEALVGAEGGRGGVPFAAGAPQARRSVPIRAAGGPACFCTPMHELRRSSRSPRTPPCRASTSRPLGPPPVAAGAESGEAAATLMGRVTAEVPAQGRARCSPTGRAFAEGNEVLLATEHMILLAAYPTLDGPPQDYRPYGA